jgi:hypothetical protein
MRETFWEDGEVMIKAKSTILIVFRVAVAAGKRRSR